MDARDYIRSIRRLIGDTDIDRYIYSDQDLAFYFKDAVEFVNGKIYFNNVIAITTNSVAIARTPSDAELALYKLQTIIFLKESSMMDAIYDGGMVSVGDIKVDVTGILRLRRDDIKQLKEEMNNLIYDVKMNISIGYEIDTYVDGLIRNSIGTSEVNPDVDLDSPYSRY